MLLSVKVHLTNFYAKGNMKRVDRKIILIITALLFFNFSVRSQVRILTIGDSTMANYDEEKNSGEKEMRGWVQMLPTFLNDNVELNNAAKNGRSSKSFYYEFWESLRETLKPGDYVFIQFGHNDEKADGLDSDENDKKQRGTAAWGQYLKYLGLYISESRERGAIPILFTPVVRRLFDENNKNIIGKGLHNLTDIAPDDSTMNYPLAMRSLAYALSVPLVDMTSLTEKSVKDFGAEKSKEIIYANNDNTHLKLMGGVLFAKLAVEELLRQNILTENIVISGEPVIKTTTAEAVGKEGITIPHRGRSVTVFWNPAVNDNPQQEGNIIAAVNFEGLKPIQKDKTYLISTLDDKWPAGDIDINASRYVELEVFAPDADLYVESIILDLGATGGDEMAFTALGSTDKSFSDSYTLSLMESLSENQSREYNYKKVIKVSDGQKLYIRIYPWYKTQSVNKYLNINNIRINGQAMSEK